MLPTLRLADRLVPARSTVTDRVLGVSRRRRQAAYLAIGAGLKLLRPMLVRVGTVVGSLVLVAFVSMYLRSVF